MQSTQTLALLEDLNTRTPSSVNRRTKSYIRWVQQSLNRLIGANLIVDGIRGSRTRQATRRFQQRAGLRTDGIVGSRTEAALIAAGAAPPPTATTTPSGRATLRDLHTFSRRFLQQMIDAGTKLDCADVAIELWIRFGERHNIPVQFRIWNSRRGRYTDVTRQGVRDRSTSTWIRRFRSTSDFARYVRNNLGALGLIKHTHPVPGGHRAAVAGDVYLWEFFSVRTGKRHRWGHTRVVDRIVRGPGGPSTDRITIVQGTLPAQQLKRLTKSAAWFRQSRTGPRTTDRGQELHRSRLVGTGPRRFNGFRNLR